MATRAVQNEERRYLYIVNGVNTAGDSANRCRLQFRFMLDVSKSDERHMAKWLETLKKDNKFTPTIRSAMTLVHDLQNGSTDQLDSQFPYLYDRLIEQVRGELEKSYKGKIEERDKRITELEAENRTHREHIERLERLLASRPVQAPSEAPTLRTASPPKVEALPELEIKAAVVDGKASVANFMRSLNGIAASYHEQAPVELEKPAPVIQSGNAKAMDVPTFDAPDFDDDLLEIDL